MATDGRCSAASDGNRDRCTIRCADADAYLPLGRCRPLGSSVLRARLRIQPQDSQLGFCAVGVRRAGGAIERFNQKTLPPPGKLTLLPPGKLSRLLRPYETAPRAAALWAARSFFFFFFRGPSCGYALPLCANPEREAEGEKQVEARLVSRWLGLFRQAGQWSRSRCCVEPKGPVADHLRLLDPADRRDPQRRSE